MMTTVQFFVRLLSGRTIVLVGNSTDKVSSVLEKIESRTGMHMNIPRQRLIYGGKQLQWDKTLEECGVDKDAELKLVASLESTSNPEAWRLIYNDIVPLVFSISQNPRDIIMLQFKLREFLYQWKISKDPKTQLEMFTASSAPQALVMLYMSAHRRVADDDIRLFVTSISVNYNYVVFYHTRHQRVSVVLELCKLLGVSAGSHDSLYRFCRDTLRLMVLEGKECELTMGLLPLHEIFPFAQELVIKMSRDWVFSDLRESPPLDDIDDFAALLAILRRDIKRDPSFSQINVPFDEKLSSLPVCHRENITYFRGFFLDLLGKFDTYLMKIEEKRNFTTLSSYLKIFKQLTIFSKLYSGCKEIFRDTMKRRKKTISYLIVNYLKRSDDIEWIFDIKELIEFEAKRHIAQMMLPEVNHNVEPFEMLINRSHLLAQSFEYISHGHPDSLRAGLFMRFKKEKAIGRGVVREWFVLVCEQIFNPQNALFVACPNDRRRFLPNPASNVNTWHLQYFRFCGRVIALALLHKVHIGIVLDRAFVLQLAGHGISLEDIRDADPYLYSSCKQILEMDAEFVDQDALGLTFVHEIEEFGKRKEVELCAGGRSMAVNSKNRMQYVDSLIQQRFVTSICQQVEHFASGFADITGPKHKKYFFNWLDQEDLDRMLHGSENSISVDDWRAHTDYLGFKITDSQISWFWETVGYMTQEQKKVLLFFWTSIKYLPVEGFGGLASRLQIHKAGERSDRLPTSHTCFYQLCFPSYPSLSVTRDRFGIITQEHVGFSFGNL